MKKHDAIQKRLDDELDAIHFTPDMCSRVQQRAKPQRPISVLFRQKRLIAFLLAGIVCVGTVFASTVFILNRGHVNHQELPELNPMYQVHVNPVEHPDGFQEFHAGSYRKLMQELGISLLDSPLSEDSDFMRICDETDNKTEHWITIENYILGDTSDFVYDQEIHEYRYSAGKQYYSPVSLEVVISCGGDSLPSERDYLGYYELEETYTSAQGCTVNIVKETTDTLPNDPNFQYRRYAIFVVHGIRYTLTGQVSNQMMKQIVDSMQ